MRYDAVLFDLDGTLTESAPGIMNSVEYSLKQLDRTDYTLDTLSTFIGPPLYETYREVMGMDHETALRGVSIYRERFSKIGWMENSVYTGIPTLLKTLKQNGAYIALATAKPRPFTEKIVEYFGLNQYIDHISAIELTDHHASKEELVRSALPKQFKHAVMVGDRKYDLEGARANHIDAVGALYGYGNLDEMLPFHPEFVADSIASLSDYLLGDTKRVKGKFISVEGLDGAGKTTQINKLHAWLKSCGHDVLLTREPGGCSISEKIRELVLSTDNIGMSPVTEALLYAASRAQHVRQVIVPALEAGRMVLCDRFLDSSIAYQAYGRGLGYDSVMDINRLAVDGNMPDITIFLDVHPEKAIMRRSAASTLDRIESEQQSFHTKVYNGFVQQIQMNPDRVYPVDASQDIDSIFHCIKSKIMQVI